MQDVAILILLAVGALGVVVVVFAGVITRWMEGL